MSQGILTVILVPSLSHCSPDQPSLLNDGAPVPSTLTRLLLGKHTPPFRKCPQHVFAKKYWLINQRLVLYVKLSQETSINFVWIKQEDNLSFNSQCPLICSHTMPTKPWTESWLRRWPHSWLRSGIFCRSFVCTRQRAAWRGRPRALTLRYRLLWRRPRRPRPAHLSFQFRLWHVVSLYFKER